MKNIVFLIAALFIISCSTEDTTKTSGFDTTGFEISKIKGTDITHVIKKDTSGAPLIEGYLRNGMQIGQWMTYDPAKSSVVSITSYIDGVLNGFSFKVSSRGYLDERIGYKNGELHGKHLKYRYGRPQFESVYKMGQLDGVQKEYYDNGKLQQETSFKDGVQHGDYKYYSDDGILRMSYVYKKGKKVSGGITEVEEKGKEME